MNRKKKEQKQKQYSDEKFSTVLYKKLLFHENKKEIFRIFCDEKRRVKQVEWSLLGTFVFCKIEWARTDPSFFSRFSIFIINLQIVIHTPEKPFSEIGFDRICDTPLRNTLFCTKGHKKLPLFKMDKSNICCVIKIFDPWFLINAHIYVHRGKHFFSCLLYNSLARGSCNKWQENIDKLGLTVKQFTQVSRHYFLFLLFISSSSFDELGVSQLRQLKISRHLFFCFFFLLLLLVNRRVLSWDSWNFLVTILFFFFFLLVSSKYTITLRGIVQKKWQEIIDKLGLTVKRFTNFSSLFLFFLVFILHWRTRLFSDDTAEYFSSLFLFFVSFLFLLSILLPCAG